MATTGTADIYKRDYTAPTEYEKFDKSMLPKIMQVRNFGKRSRTKYTHLADQDTYNAAKPARDNPNDLSDYARGTVSAMAPPTHGTKICTSSKISEIRPTPPVANRFYLLFLVCVYRLAADGV